MQPSSVGSLSLAHCGVVCPAKMLKEASNTSGVPRKVKRNVATGDMEVALEVRQKTVRNWAFDWLSLLERVRRCGRNGRKRMEGKGFCR